jgi:ABC-2 type transport system permease protein
MQGFQLIMNFLVMPIVFLSGAFFPLNGLPGFLKVITQIDPLSYGVDGLRGVLTGAHVFSIGFDFGILAVLSALLLGVGSFLFEKIQD